MTRSAVQGLVAWVAALLAGSCLGLGVRLTAFFAGAVLLRELGHLIPVLALLVPSLDPVYTRAAESSVIDLRIQGAAVIGLLGDWLHTSLPSVFLTSSHAHWAIARLIVEPGSPVLGRLLASGFAHAVTLSVGLILVRYSWRHHRSWLLVMGLAMQVQIAIGILGAQPSIRELEATGISFAANALLPGLAPRDAALTDGPAQIWPALQSAVLVALALLLGYLPVGLYLLLRDATRRITLGTAAVVMLGSAACAGVLREDAVLANPAPLIPVAAAAPSISDAPPVRVAVAAPTGGTITLDRWFDASTDGPGGPSHVEVVGSDYRYQYLVNGRPEVIKGMGLNTQYAQLLSPEDRAARIDSDFSELSALGVNTVLGWDPAEFDRVLLDAADRHGIGVVMPFDLDPQADYTDPQVRQRLHDEALAWVTRYRNHPAVRMWGLGNEVLHKIVHPAWAGPQDPERARQAEAFSDWLVQTADDIHALDPDHPVTYRSAEDAFVDWVIAALNRQGGGPRPWFVWGTNCYQPYLSDIVDHWTQVGMPTALWVSEFAPGTMAVPDRPDGFATMWGYIRKHPDWVLGGAVYAWTRNGPEGVDRTLGSLTTVHPLTGAHSRCSRRFSARADAPRAIRRAGSSRSSLRCEAGSSCGWYRRGRAIAGRARARWSSSSVIVVRLASGSFRLTARGSPEPRQPACGPTAY
jgi:Glycosyl hydrolases family 2, TIM barrel domain